MQERVPDEKGTWVTGHSELGLRSGSSGLQVTAGGARLATGSLSCPGDRPKGYL